MDIDEQIEWEKEKARRRQAWEERKKAETEERARQEKQNRLKDYLARRSEAWADHTGSLPSAGMISKWQEEYVEKLAADREIDLELRRARAAAEYDVW